MPSKEAIEAAKAIIEIQPALLVGTRRNLTQEYAEIIDRQFERVRNAYALAASIDREFGLLAGRIDQLCCDLNPDKHGGCGDCDPCLGGRPDQCAVDPT